MKYDIDLLKDYGNVININSLSESQQKYIQKEIKNGSVIEAYQYSCNKCNTPMDTSALLPNDLFEKILDNKLPLCSECNSDLNLTIFKNNILKVNISKKHMKAINYILDAAPNLSRDMAKQLFNMAKYGQVFSEYDLMFKDDYKEFRDNKDSFQLLIDRGILIELTEVELYCDICDEAIVIDEYLSNLIREYKDLLSSENHSFRLEMLFEELNSQSYLLLCQNDCDYGWDLDDLINKYDEEYAYTVYSVSREVLDL